MLEAIERTIQTVRNLQKTLVVQLEESIKCKIPRGHAVLYWAAMHSTWLYNRYLTHSTTKITPYQAVNGRPYHNRIACFGQVTYGLDPKGSKYRPTWKKGMWLGKDGSDFWSWCSGYSSWHNYNKKGSLRPRQEATSFQEFLTESDRGVLPGGTNLGSGCIFYAQGVLPWEQTPKGVSLRKKRPCTVM